MGLGLRLLLLFLVLDFAFTPVSHPVFAFFDDILQWRRRFFSRFTPQRNFPIFQNGS